METLRNWSRIAIAGLMLLATPAIAQETVLAPPTVQELELQIQALEADSSGNGASSVAVYQEAIAALGRAAEMRKREKGFADEAAEAPAIIKKLTQDPAAPDPAPLDGLPASTSLTVLDDRLAQAQADLAAQRAQLAEYESSAARRTKLKAELPGEITSQQKKLAAAEEALLAFPAGPEQEARRSLLLAQAEESKATIAALETQRNTYEVRRDLLNLNRDIALRDTNRSEGLVGRLQKRVDAKRAVEGDSTARSAESVLDEITGRFPNIVTLAELAQETRASVAMRSGQEGLPRRIALAQEDKEKTRQQLEEVRDRFRSARKRILIGELTEGMGQILRSDFRWLPLESDLKSGTAQVEKLLSNAQIELISTEELRRAVGVLESAPDRFLQNLELDSPPEDLRAALQEVFKIQRDAHDAVLKDLETLTLYLYGHRDLSKNLEQEAQEYREVIKNRILWVRSSPPNPIKSLIEIPKHLLDLAKALKKQFTQQALAEVAVERWEGLVSIGLLFFATVAMRGSMKRRRREYGELVRSYKTDKYSYTIAALGISCFLALPLPLLTWTIGWVLTEFRQELPQAAGTGLTEISLAWFVLRFVR